MVGLWDTRPKHNGAVFLVIHRDWPSLGVKELKLAKEKSPYPLPLTVTPPCNCPPVGGGWQLQLNCPGEVLSSTGVTFRGREYGTHKLKWTEINAEIITGWNRELSGDRQRGKFTRNEGKMKIEQAWLWEDIQVQSEWTKIWTYRWYLQTPVNQYFRMNYPSLTRVACFTKIHWIIGICIHYI